MAFIHQHAQAPGAALNQGRHRETAGGGGGGGSPALHPLIMPVSPSTSSTDTAGYANPRSASSPYSATSTTTTATTSSSSSTMFSPSLPNDQNYDDGDDDDDNDDDDVGDNDNASSATTIPRTAAAAGAATTAAALPARSAAKGVKTGRTPSRYDWSKYMTTIKRLYIDEDKTLREVLEIMEREHNFIATPRMVKTRLKKWGYTKNVSVKTEEVQSLMELIIDAENQGDVRRNSTEVTLATGRVVGLDRVAAHLRRKRLPSHVVQKASSHLTMIRYGRSPSPRATLIDSPAAFLVSEHILTDLHSYVYAHSGDPGRENMVTTSNAQDKPVYDLVISARNFIAQDKMPEALALLRKAPDQIKQLLSSNLMTIPRCLFLLFINLLSIPGIQQLSENIKQRLNLVIKALVRYVAALATDSTTLNWPEGHPLRRVLLNLNQADDEDLLEVLIRGYKRILLSFESFPDASTRGRTVPAWLDLGNAVGFETIPVENLEAALWKDYESRRASSAQQKPPVQQVFWMAELERQKVRARRIPTQRLQELYKMTLEACEDNDDEYTLLAELNCHYYLAGLYQQQDQRALAEDHMRQSIDRCNLRGETGSAARLMTELQGWMREWGEKEKVEAMQHEITGQMSNLGLDLSGSEEDEL
ncbi:hypothetical protein M406DRAFT_109056 [Cryphonectria parasitica EP155]|uniref:Clr5 domain-containing protein n=1 Tax=Cryphonectria parasitica (strain ATCC 38755 / EP155) TaxID=660469 RepID=A0A9P4Y0D3_CRYP1|nr:uncharacterized protein M406DRAFT_109056 [Cryphonectria parasitica EP155]KAF3763830.1 hypothetical protein M406DRAFT_109056 [Cryphonectria parasitica EP155]